MSTYEKPDEQDAASTEENLTEHDIMIVAI